MEDQRVAKPPDEAALREAALTYLARYSATRGSLTRVLDRRVDRWARAAKGDDVPAQAAAAKQVVRAVVAWLSDVRAVDDLAFARARARRLAQGGHSRVAVTAHLAERGVTAEAVRAALPADADIERAAAVAFMRRRRLGPFRKFAAGPEERKRESAALARAGFTRDVAMAALALSREDAEAILALLRQA